QIGRAAVGWATGLALLSRSSPVSFMKLAIGIGAWLFITLGVGAYLAGRTTGRAARPAPWMERRFNALIAGMLLFLALNGPWFGVVFSSLSAVAGVIQASAGHIIPDGGSSQTGWNSQ